MRQVFLQKRSDLKWLREVHLPTGVKVSFRAALLFGNEHWPDRIVLYPLISDTISNGGIVYDGPCRAQIERDQEEVEE